MAQATLSSDAEEESDGAEVFTAFVSLTADYVIRASATPLKLDEVHVLRIVKTDEPRISSVRILLDELALEAAMLAPSKNSGGSRKMSKAQRLLGAEAPEALPTTHPYKLQRDAERLRQQQAKYGLAAAVAVAVAYVLLSRQRK